MVRIDQQTKDLIDEKARKQAKQPSDMSKILDRVRYLLEHLDEMLLQQIDPIKKAKLYGVTFDKAPTYDDLQLGAQKNTSFYRGESGLRFSKNGKISCGERKFDGLEPTQERIDCIWFAFGHIKTPCSGASAPLHYITK